MKEELYQKIISLLLYVPVYHDKPKEPSTFETFLGNLAGFFLFIGIFLPILIFIIIYIFAIDPRKKNKK